MGRVGLRRLEYLMEALSTKLALGGDTQLVGYKKVIDSTTLNTGGAVTTTLTRAQSGTIFTVDGTGDIVVNMPTVSAKNVGLFYDFVVTTAVGGSKTVIFVLPGSDVSDWYSIATLTGNASTCALTIDNNGDTLTLQNSTVVGTRVRLTCLTDDGTNSVWQADSVGSPVATNA